MSTEERSTPPVVATRAPPTEEQQTRAEVNRLKAIAIREALKEQAESEPTISHPALNNAASPSSLTPGNKRSFATMANNRKGGEGRGDIAIKPARKFQKFVEYEFATMTDTKGGFISTEDDPHSMLSAVDLRDKPAHMSLEDWAKHQLKMKLMKEKSGPYEPGLSALTMGEKEQIRCYECDTVEVDWKWYEIFKCRVCAGCKDKVPEKYSLLTKTECRNDYFLTDPELKDEELLPRMHKPNPHRSTWNDMMLYLRYQVEEFALKKWGSMENLDKEFERRNGVRKKRKDDKFRAKLKSLKNKTRVESWKRSTENEKHEHSWGTAVTNASGESVRTCEECGFEIEELVF
ncbi:XPA protein C-terminus-domain-containing protein [Tuber brumale]|nr:XPA protein C-terminus-domain-containing protein [Tuber brumale]